MMVEVSEKWVQNSDIGSSEMKDFVYSSVTLSRISRIASLTDDVSNCGRFVLSSMGPSTPTQRTPSC